MKIASLACFAALTVACTASTPTSDATLPTPVRITPGLTPQTVPPQASSEHVRVLRDATTQTVLALDPESVRCSSSGYSVSELKISVPDLAWLAHFDHRTFGEGLPCMTAGACTEALTPELFLAAPFQVVSLQIILTEHLQLDADHHTCTRHLEEEVRSTLSGHDFQHARSDDPTPVDYALCVELAKL